MKTVAYFTKRQLRYMSRLPGRAFTALIAVGENAISMAPNRIARVNTSLKSVQNAFDEIIEGVRENVSHLAWLVDANFSDRYVTDSTPHPLLVSK